MSIAPIMIAPTNVLVTVHVTMVHAFAKQAIAAQIVELKRAKMIVITAGIVTTELAIVTLDTKEKIAGRKSVQMTALATVHATNPMYVNARPVGLGTIVVPRHAPKIATTMDIVSMEHVSVPPVGWIEPALLQRVQTIAPNMVIARTERVIVTHHGEA